MLYILECKRRTGPWFVSAHASIVHTQAQAFELVRWLTGGGVKYRVQVIPLNLN